MRGKPQKRPAFSKMAAAMICPSCDIGIRFEFDGQSQAYSFVSPEEHLAEDIVYGTCPDCNEIIVVKRKGEWKTDRDYGRPLLTKVLEEEIVYPAPSSREIDSTDVPENYRDDFAEAASVLDLSPKASAAISRRLLQHLLREQFKVKSADLSREIDEFLKDNHVPSYIAEQIDAIRNVGNFAAHPLKDSQAGTIVDVEPGEAEWLLDVLESLFDFAFIQPARAREARERLNEKLSAAGKPSMKSPAAKKLDG
jgi:hypothetical protein